MTRCEAINSIDEMVVPASVERCTETAIYRLVRGFSGRSQALCAGHSAPYRGDAVPGCALVALDAVERA